MNIFKWVSYWLGRNERKRQEFILDALKDAARPMFGIDLIKASNGLLGGGTTYVTLARMEEKGLIVSELPADGKWRYPRRQYRLADKPPCQHEWQVDPAQYQSLRDQQFICRKCGDKEHVHYDFGD